MVKPVVFLEGALGEIGSFGRVGSFERTSSQISQSSQNSQNSQIDGRAGCIWGWAVERIESPLNDSHLTTAGLERRQQPRADRREVVAIEDCRDGWAMWRKVLFSHNRPSNTNICVANNNRPQTSLPRRHTPNECLYPHKKQRSLPFPKGGLEGM